MFSSTVASKQSSQNLRGDKDRDRERDRDKDRDLAIAADGSYVETTSLVAARALARAYNEMKGKSKGKEKEGSSEIEQNEDGVEQSEYVVTTRTDDKGRAIYRIRPRSRPPSPDPSSPVDSDGLRSSHRRRHSISPSSPLSPNDSYIRPLPEFHLTRVSQDPSSSLAGVQKQRAIKYSRSIPHLRSDALNVPVIDRDERGFYNPSSIRVANPPVVKSIPEFRPSPSERERQRSESTPSSFASTESLRFNGARDADVLGRLLGWSSTPASTLTSAGPRSPGRASKVPDIFKMAEASDLDETLTDEAYASGTVTAAPIPVTGGSVGLVGGASKDGRTHPADVVVPPPPPHPDLPIDLIEQLGNSPHGSPRKTSYPVSQSSPSHKSGGSAGSTTIRIDTAIAQSHAASKTANANIGGEEISAPISPFGEGVRLPPQRKPKSLQNPKSRGDLFGLFDQFEGPPSSPGRSRQSPETSAGPSSPLTPVPSSGMKSIRGVASSESMMTARLGDDYRPFMGSEEDHKEILGSPFSSTRPVKRQKTQRYTNHAIFDVFNTTITERSGGSGGPYSQSNPVEHSGYDERGSPHQLRGHERMASTSSLNSSLSQSSRATAHHITISSAPGDDRRFVIWGYKHGPSNASNSNNSNTIAPQRPSTSSMIIIPAQEGSTGSGGPSGSSPHTNSPKRWSIKDRKSINVDILSSPNAGSHSGSGRDSLQSSSSLSSQGQHTGQKVLLAATAERWIAELTSKINDELLTEFFLTYRLFMAPTDLCRLLILRFQWALGDCQSAEDEAGRRIVRVRTFVALRYWLLNYFPEDFVPNRELRTMFADWLNEQARRERLRVNQNEVRLIKSLKKVVKRLKEAYSTVGPQEAAEASRLLSSFGRTGGPQKDFGTGRSSMREATSSQSLSSKIYEEPQEEVDIEIRIPSQAEEEVDIDLDLESSSSLTEPAAHKDQADVGNATPPYQIGVSMPGSPARLKHQGSGATIGIYSSSPASHHRGLSSLAAPDVYQSSTPKSPTTAPPVGTLSMPHNSNLFSRTLTSTMGTFGRVKRMLGNRAMGSSPSMACNTIAPFDDLELERDETGDLLYVKGGLERYLKFFELRHSSTSVHSQSDDPISTSESPASSDTRASTDSPITPADSDNHDSLETSGLGISGLPEVPEDVDNEASTPTVAGQVLHHSVSNQTIKSQMSNVHSAKAKHPSRLGDQLLDEQGGLTGGQAVLFVSSNEPAVIQLDDLDLSDTDDEGNNIVKRTLRRLPAARDLRLAGTMKNLNALTRRDSEATTSSLGTHRIPSYAMPMPMATSRESSASIEGEDEGLAIGGVNGFTLEGMESDEEEPGDVEAALRRLEGQIDEGKQKEKAKRVEAQMHRSKQLSQQLKNFNPHRAEGDDIDAASDAAGTEDDSVSIPPSSDSSQKHHPASFEGSSEPRDSGIGTSTDASESPSKMRRFTAKVPSQVAPQPSANTRRSLDVSQQRPPPDSFKKRATMAVTTKPTGTGRRSIIGRKPSVRRLFAASNARPFSGTRPSGGLSLPPLPPVHRSFLLVSRTEVVAQQFCLIERDLLRAVGWQELIAGSWRNRSLDTETRDWELFLKERAREIVESKGRGERPPMREVQAIIARFNLTCNWVASEIVLTTVLQERVALVGKFIRLAWKCYRQANYQTLTQIIHGLQTPCVERLHKTWAKVGFFEMRIFKDLKAFTSHLKNFKWLRSSMTASVEEWGPPGQGPAVPRSSSVRSSTANVPGLRHPSGGCIPFLGLFLRDLTINAELPTYLDPSSPTSPANLDPNTGELDTLVDPSALDDLPPLPDKVDLAPLINVHKYRIVSSTVQKILVFQELTELYPYEADTSLFLKVLKIRCLDVDTMRECSYMCEPA